MLEKNLNELNIFALRDLARKTGVVSPTSKKKDQLIKEIVEIISGKKKPAEDKPKQGRPPKTFGYSFANVFNNNVEAGFDFGSQTLNQDVDEYEVENLTTVAGWLELVNNNSALLWVYKDFKNEIYFVPNSVLKDLNVKIGDRVVAEIERDASRKIVKKIFSINDCPVMRAKKDRTSYSDIDHMLPNRMLPFSSKMFSKLNLKYGENIYVYGNNNNNNTINIIKMINDCKIENKIYINVSIAEKNKIFITELQNTENFLSNITDEVDIARRLVCLATERAKRILEQGQDVLVVVDDLASIGGIDNNDLMLIKNLVSITKEGRQNGSITIVAVMPKEEFSQIEKLSDVRLKIEGAQFDII